MICAKSDRPTFGKIYLTTCVSLHSTPAPRLHPCACAQTGSISRQSLKRLSRRARMEPCRLGLLAPCHFASGNIVHLRTPLFRRSHTEWQRGGQEGGPGISERQIHLQAQQHTPTQIWTRTQTPIQTQANQETGKSKHRPIKTQANQNTSQERAQEDTHEDRP